MYITFYTTSDVTPPLTTIGFRSVDMFTHSPSTYKTRIINLVIFTTIDNAVSEFEVWGRDPWLSPIIGHSHNVNLNCVYIPNKYITLLKH